MLVSTVLADLHSQAARFGFSNGVPAVPNTNPTRQRGFCCNNANANLWLTEPSLTRRVSVKEMTWDVHEGTSRQCRSRWRTS
jgi:hypothetical protein